MTPTAEDGLLEGPDREVSMEDTRFQAIVDDFAARRLGNSNIASEGHSFLAEQGRMGYLANKDLYNFRQASAQRHVTEAGGTSTQSQRTT